SKDERPILGRVPLQHGHHGPFRQGRRPLLPLDLVGGVQLDLLGILVSWSRRLAVKRRKPDKSDNRGQGDDRTTNLHGVPPWNERRCLRSKREQDRCNNRGAKSPQDGRVEGGPSLSRLPVPWREC